MEITRLNIISDFVLPLTKVPRDFWKWGALLFAVFAACTSLFARIKLYILQLHSIKHSSLLPPHHHHHHFFDQQLLNHNSDFSDDDDDNSTTDHEEFNSPLAYNVDEDDDDDDTINKVDQDFNVAGLHSTMSELFTTGKNVVKQWDNLDLGFQDKLTDDNLCMYDTTIYEHENTVVYTSLTDTSNGVKLYVFDKRMRPRVPVIYAEWDSRLVKVEGVRYDSGIEKVYDGACRVGDLRRVRCIKRVV